MPRYEFSKGKSSKFWEVKLDGKTVVTNYGRIGSIGQSTTKTFPDTEKAKYAYENLIKQKTGKGYVQRSGKALDAASAAGKPAKVEGNSDTHYLVVDESDRLWLGYGWYLANGYARRVAGILELIRTGPYLPAMSFLHGGEVLVSEKLRKALEKESLSGVTFKKTIKKKVVTVAWHTWDRKAKEPKVYPKNSEPDLYFDRKHNPEVAKALGSIFELEGKEVAVVEGPDDGAKTINLAKRPYDLFFAKHGHKGVWVANAKAKELLQKHVDSWVKFEPLKVTVARESEKVRPVATKQHPPSPTSDPVPEPTLRIMGPNGERPYNAVFSFDKTKIAVQLGNWLVQIWDLKKAKLISEDAFRGPTGKGKPTQLAVCPGTAGIALHAGSLFGLRGSGRKALLSKKPGAASCTSIDLGPRDDGSGGFSPDQKYFVWPTGKHLATINLTTKKIRQAPWKGMPDYSPLVVSLDATHAALIQNGEVIWIEASTGKELWRNKAPDELSSMFLMNSGRLFVGGNKGWQIVKVSNGSVAASVNTENNVTILRAAYLGGDRLLVVYSNGERVELAAWNCKSPRLEQRFDLNSGDSGYVVDLVSSFDASWVGAVLKETLIIWEKNAFGMGIAV